MRKERIVNMDLTNIIEQYNINNIEKNRFTKAVKQLGDEIKQAFKVDGISEFRANTVVAKVSTSERSKLLDNKVIELNEDNKFSTDLKELGVLVEKLVVDEEALESAIYKGDLTQSDLQALAECYDVSVIESLKISKIKEDK